MKVGKKIMALAAWLTVSTAMTFAQERPAADGVACIQVIAYAVDPVKGICRQFPTPCDVPAGWRQVQACPTLTAAEIEGLWVIGSPDPASELRFLSVRSSGNISVLVLLNAWSWNAFVTSFDGRRLPVITFDGNGFNQWSVVFDSARSGAIVGERCLPGSDRSPMPLVHEQAAVPTTRAEGIVSATPGTGSMIPDGVIRYPSNNCRVPEGVSIPIGRLL